MTKRDPRVDPDIWDVVDCIHGGVMIVFDRTPKTVYVRRHSYGKTICMRLTTFQRLCKGCGVVYAVE